MEKATNLYKSINLNKPDFKDYSINGKTLSNLTKINIFIGPNNSGKSRFLRAIFSSKEIEFTSEIVDLDTINNTIKRFRKEIEEYYKQHKIISVPGINYAELCEINFLANSTNLKELFYDKIEQIISQANPDEVTLAPDLRINTNGVNSIRDFINTIVPKYLSELNHIKTYNKELVERKNIYIPTLRGLRNISYHGTQLSNQDNYQLRTQKDYFSAHTGIETGIFTGLSLYDDVKKLLLGSGEDRQKIKNFEEFLKRNFFNNADFNIIPHIDDNAVHVKIGEDEYPIYQLGEGIQAIIILTYPLFFNQNENLNVLYEEPDQFLHPGFQRIFLETLMLPEFKNFQFYLTTHSNHFLDMTLDFNKISVYTFQKKSKTFLIENVENETKNVLEILGVRNSSVYLSNCTIWVEGITDRIYIRKFLELFQKDKNSAFLEDIHYSFVEYGGGNITHWSFLEDSDESHPNINVATLCGKLFLITDSDGAGLNKNGVKSKKLERQEALKNKLGDQFYCLESKEIENLLSSNVIIKVIKEYEESFDSLDFSKVKLEKYSTKFLGTFIETNVVGLKRGYASDSGTMKDKVGFSKKAVNYMIDISELTEEAKILTQKIYDFIKKNN